MPTYYQEHKAEKQAYQKARYQEHKAERQAYQKAYNKAHYQENKAYYQDNKDEILAHYQENKAERQVYYQENKVKILASQKVYGKAYREEHKAERNAHKARRRAIKIKATPKWLTKDHYKQMLRWYERAIELGLTVDHIIPLNSSVVCGLHVPWNMQLLTASENSSKGNKFVVIWKYDPISNLHS